MLVHNARYHVTARINHQEMRLEEPSTKLLFIQTIKRAKFKYPFRVDNFTVMGNHFHLVIKPQEEASLSKIMQWILGVFAMLYNRKNGLTGHLWQGRFFSRIINSIKDLCETNEYIDDNPVQVGLVRHQAEWSFGGIADRLLGCFGILDPPESDAANP